jgi:hypothetical protein
MEVLNRIGMRAKTRMHIATTLLEAVITELTAREVQ